jgi:hypothetical protein
VGECADVVGAGVDAVVQIRPGGGQTSTARIEYVGIEMFTQTLGHEAPGDRRAGNARDQNQRGFVGMLGATVAQVVLTNTVGVDIATVNEGAHAGTPDFRS